MAPTTKPLKKFLLSLHPTVVSGDLLLFYATVCTTAHISSPQVSRSASSKGFFGSNPFEEATINSWLEWVKNELSLPSQVLLYTHYDLLNKADSMEETNHSLNLQDHATTQARADVVSLLKYLEQQLDAKSFLVGETITLADVAGMPLS